MPASLPDYGGAVSRDATGESSGNYLLCCFFTLLKGARVAVQGTVPVITSLVHSVRPPTPRRYSSRRSGPTSLTALFWAVSKRRASWGTWITIDPRSGDLVSPFDSQSNHPYEVVGTLWRGVPCFVRITLIWYANRQGDFVGRQHNVEAAPPSFV